MKYKIIAIANFLIGGAQLIIAAAMILVVIPRMSALYNEVAVDLNPLTAYIPSFFSVLAGAVNIHLGFTLLRSKDKKLEKYFKISIIYLAISFIIAAVSAQLSVLSTIGPLYSLTSELKMQ